MGSFQYGSKVARLAAYCLDVIVFGIVQAIVVKIVPGFSSLFGFLLFVYFWLCHYFYGMTLGKKVFGLEVVDEKTGSKMTLGNAFLRDVIGRFISAIALGLGFIWILFDKKRQGWHDKISGSLVIQKVPLAGAKKVIAYIIVFAFPVIAIIGIVIAILLVAINPAAQIQKANLYKQQQMQTP